jgi:hypothetical protein
MALNFGSMMGSQGRGNFNLTYRGVSIQDSVASSITSGSFSIGNADAERWVICCIFGYDYLQNAYFLSTSTICGITVDGNYVEGFGNDGSGYYYRCIIAWAKVPTGTSGTVVANFATSMEGCTFHTFTCIGGQNNYKRAGGAADAITTVYANNITTTDGFLLASSFMGTSGTGNTTFDGTTGLSSTPKIENYYHIRGLWPSLLAIDWMETTPKSNLLLSATTSATEDRGSGIAAVSWGDILPSLAGKASVEYTAGYMSGTGISSFSQTLNIGTAAPNRYVIVVVYVDISSLGTVTPPTTVTVNGASTTQVATFGGDTDSSLAFYITDAPVSSGSTATIATNTATNANQIAAAIYVAYDIDPIPYDTLIVEATDPSGTIDVPDAGFTIAAATSASGASISWTGATAVSANTGVESYFTGLNDNTDGISPLAGHTITALITSGETDDKLVAVSWRAAY